MTTSPFRRASSVAVLTICLGALAVSIGCDSTPDYRDMSAVQRAKAISTRRKQAEYQLSVFQASSDAEAGLEALELFAEHHAETTKIAPGSCELCFYYAGLAMAQLGTYYREEVLRLDRRLEDGTPAEVAAIEAEIEESEKIMRRYFLDSSRYFETYIRQAGAIVDTRAYWKLADNYAALEDWRRALRYLDVFEKAQPLAETQNDLPAIRSSFKMKLRLQEERELDEELQRSGTRRSQRPQMSN